MYLNYEDRRIAHARTASRKSNIFVLSFVEDTDIFNFQVPVVLIFTKFDALEDMCYSKLRGQGMSHEAASIQVPEFVRATAGEVAAEGAQT